MSYIFFSLRQERGFICAEVMAYDDLKELGDEDSVKKAGKYRQQGKKYAVMDGDIIFFVCEAFSNSSSLPAFLLSSLSNS